jgi:hypothetical protein
MMRQLHLNLFIHSRGHHEASILDLVRRDRPSLRTAWA